MNSHAATTDAHAYWRQFATTEDFTEPGRTVTGVIEHLGELRTRDDWVPRLRIRQPDGSIVTVNAGPKRLLAELKRLCPKVGDHIKIRYLGPEAHALPGMQPTRRFAVAVRPADTNETAAPPHVDPATGELDGPDPTATEGQAVDAPGPDPETIPTMEGPTPPASNVADTRGPGPDEAGYINPNGRVHVPTNIRPEVAATTRRIQALDPDEKESFRAWLAAAKIPDAVDVSAAKLKAVNAELDRRGAAADAGER